MAELVVLGLGSNKDFLQILDDGSEQLLKSEQILKCAVSCLEEVFVKETMKTSSIYKSSAMYYENQQDFLNMVVCGQYEKLPKNYLLR